MVSGYGSVVTPGLSDSTRSQLRKASEKMFELRMFLVELHRVDHLEKHRVQSLGVDPREQHNSPAGVDSSRKSKCPHRLFVPLRKEELTFFSWGSASSPLETTGPPARESE